MKHCLNCYRKIPNDAEVCNYCGAPQQTHEQNAKITLDRCPRCMSFLYNKQTGCQFCGYHEDEGHRKRQGIILIAIIAALFVFFILWQAGVFPSLPYSGELLSIVQNEPTAPVLPDGEEPENTDAADGLIALAEEETPTPEATSVPEAEETPAEERDILRDILSSIVDDILAKKQAGAAEGAFSSGNTYSSYHNLYNMVLDLINTTYPDLDMETINSGSLEQFKSEIVESAVFQLSMEGMLAFLAPQPEGEPTEAPFICENHTSRFKPGMTGSILKGGLINRVRAEPSTESEEVAILVSSATFEVLDDDPVCNEGYLWLHVRLSGSGIIGWTVESNRSSYWLVPIQ